MSSLTGAWSPAAFRFSTSLDGLTPLSAAIWMRSTWPVRPRISRAVFAVTIEKVAPLVPRWSNRISPTTLYVWVGRSVASLIVPPIAVFAWVADHVSTAISSAPVGMRPGDEPKRAELGVVDDRRDESRRPVASDLVTRAIYQYPLALHEAFCMSDARHGANLRDERCGQRGSCGTYVGVVVTDGQVAADHGRGVAIGLGVPLVEATDERCGPSRACR